MIYVTVYLLVLPIVNFSNFRHVDRPIFRSQMSRKWSQAACPVSSEGAKDVVPSSWNMPVCEKLAPRRAILIYALDLAPERRRPAPLGEPALDLGRVRHLRGTSGSRRRRVDGAGM